MGSSKDPFSWITNECKLSSYREIRRLICAPYYAQSNSDDSTSDSDSDSDSGSDGDPDSKWRSPSDIPVASTGIVMVSPPESSDDELPRGSVSLSEDQEIFHTPPESSFSSLSFENCNDEQAVGAVAADARGEIDSVYADSADSTRAVDLTRDTDLGVSEAESSPHGGPQKESGVEIRVSKRGSSPIGQSSVESPAKKLKGLDFVSPTTVKLGSSGSDDNKEELGLEDQQNFESNAEVGEPISGSIQRPIEVIDSEDKERNMESDKNNGEGSSREGNAENENGEENSGRCKETVEETAQKRVLPAWATESVPKRVWAVKRVKFSRRRRSRASISNGADETVEVNERETLGAGNGDDERMEVNERETLGANNGDDERAEMETLGASNGGDERVERETLVASNGNDERVGVNEREALGARNGDDRMRMEVLMDLMMNSNTCDEDTNLHCLSLLEVAKGKWDTISLDGW